MTLKPYDEPPHHLLQALAEGHAGITAAIADHAAHRWTLPVADHIRADSA